jgi:hypothetical protein
MTRFVHKIACVLFVHPPKQSRAEVPRIACYCRPSFSCPLVRLCRDLSAAGASVVGPSPFRWRVESPNAPEKRKRHERSVRLALPQAALYARIWYRRQAALPCTPTSATPPHAAEGMGEHKEEPWHGGGRSKFTCEVDLKAGAATNQTRA